MICKCPFSLQKALPVLTPIQDSTIPIRFVATEDNEVPAGQGMVISVQPQMEYFDTDTGLTSWKNIPAHVANKICMAQPEQKLAEELLMNVDTDAALYVPKNNVYCVKNRSETSAKIQNGRQVARVWLVAAGPGSKLIKMDKEIQNDYAGMTTIDFQGGLIDFS